MPEKPLKINKVHVKVTRKNIERYYLEGIKNTKMVDVFYYNLLVLNITSKYTINL